MNQRIWWLAQPLWMRPVNDLRTEHYARQTMVRLEEAASSAYGLAYGDDARELTLRYAWSEAFSMDRGPEAIQPWERPVIIGHNRTPSFQFFPAGEAVANPLGSHQGDWNLRAGRTGYAPLWAQRFADVAAHAAQFRRGDSALVVAAFEVPDSTYHGRRMERLFVLSPGDGASPRIVGDTGASSGAFMVMASWSPHLVGLELYHASERKAARLRSGLAGRDEPPILSDLLLFTGGDEEAESLTELVPRSISGHLVRREFPLGLYWEGYGLDVTDPGFSSSLELRAVESGGLRRVAESLRLARPATPLRLSWSDWQGRREEISARMVEVDVSTLPAGRYLIQVVVASGGREIARTGREITIAP